MNKICEVCGKSFTPPISNPEAEKCHNCAKVAVQQLFKENPELKQAFKETIEELRKPENIKKMTEDTVKIMRKFQEIQGKRDIK